MSSSKSHVIEIHDLTVSYSSRPALWCIDAYLPEHSLIGILGPNGAGKSTLLRAIMGLIRIDSGYVKCFGQPINRVRKKISYIPQKESIDWNFPATVLDVVLMGCYKQLGLFKRPNLETRQHAMHCLEQVQIDHLAKRQIAQLSGGQQQRVLIARALAQKADLYLMDEPFSGVDISTEELLIKLMQRMTKSGKTIIMVHHDLLSAKSYFDWCLLLNMRLVSAGPTEQVFIPEVLQKTYGSQLNVLSQISDLLGNQRIPIREQ